VSENEQKGADALERKIFSQTKDEGEKGEFWKAFLETTFTCKSLSFAAS